MKSFLRLLFNFLAFLAFLAGAYFVFQQLLSSSAPLSFDERAPVSVPVVRVESVASKSYPLMIDVVGTVEALQSGNINAEVSGKIMSIADELVVGEQVSAGQVVATIDARDYDAAIIQAVAGVESAQSTLDQATAQSKVAQAELKRLGRSVDENPLAAKMPQVASAAAALASAKARLNTAREQRDKTAIVVPFDGEITAKSIVMGQQVGAGSAIAKLLSTKGRRLALQLTQEQVALLGRFKRTPESTFIAIIDSHPQQEGSSRIAMPVTHIGSAVDATSQLLTLYVDVDADSLGQDDVRSLRIGERVALSISIADPKRFITVPIAAVGQDNRVRLLAGADSRVVQSTVVEPLWWGKDRVVLQSGLQEGDIVITTPLASSVLDGSTIRLVDDPLPSATKAETSALGEAMQQGSGKDHEHVNTATTTSSAL